MNGFSRIFILGRLGMEPSMQTSKNGRHYTKLSIATHRSGRENAESESEETSTRTPQITDWYSVHVWGRQAEVCAKYLKKGQGVMVEGYLSNFQAQLEDGKPLKKIGINATKVEFLDHKPISSEQ